MRRNYITIPANSVLISDQNDIFVLFEEKIHFTLDIITN